MFRVEQHGYENKWHARMCQGWRGCSAAAVLNGCNGSDMVAAQARRQPRRRKRRRLRACDSRQRDGTYNLGNGGRKRYSDFANVQRNGAVTGTIASPRPAETGRHLRTIANGSLTAQTTHSRIAMAVRRLCVSWDRGRY
jgi:hypothetical protein